jgi:uncharacterized protein (TIGR03067 family)
MKLAVQLIALLLFAGVAGADEKADKKLIADLAGTYTVATFEKGGEMGPADFLKTIQSVTIKGTKLTIVFKEDSKTESSSATFNVDASKKPAHINLKHADGPMKDETVLGVVEIAGDTVKISWAEGGAKAKRPTDATSTKENKNLLLTLKKAKE